MLAKMNHLETPRDYLNESFGITRDIKINHFHCEFVIYEKEKNERETKTIQTNNVLQMII